MFSSSLLTDKCVAGVKQVYTARKVFGDRFPPSLICSLTISNSESVRAWRANFPDRAVLSATRFCVHGAEVAPLDCYGKSWERPHFNRNDFSEEDS